MSGSGRPGIFGRILVLILGMLLLRFSAGAVASASGVSGDPIVGRGRRETIIVWFVYAVPVVLGAALAWRNIALLSGLLFVNWLPVAFAASTGVAVGVVVMRTAGSRGPAVVAGLAVALLVLMNALSLSQVLSVDGCIAGQGKGDQQEAQNGQRGGADQAPPRPPAVGPDNRDTKKVGAQPHYKTEVSPVDCGVLSASSELKIGVVTMRLTLFAVVGTFLFGLVAVFGLLVQALSGRSREASTRSDP